MKKLMLLITILFVICFAGSSFAALEPPVVSYSTDGLDITINWTSVSGSTGYKFYYAPSPYSGPESIAEINMGTQTTLSAELWEGASFYIAVKAYNDQESSQYSNIEKITIPYTVPESPPLSYNLDGTNLSATWDAVPGATGYKLYYTLSAYTGQEAFLPVDVGNQNSFTYQGLIEGQTYSIAVAAYNDYGESDFSNVETFTPVPVENEFVNCTGVRPEICYFIFDPVCGSLFDGSFKDYSNDCVACSDPKVIGYYNGDCR